MPKTTRLRNLRKSRARCLCGLRATLHFTPFNSKLSCEDARALHPRATVVSNSLRTALVASIELAVRS